MQARRRSPISRTALYITCLFALGCPKAPPQVAPPAPEVVPEKATSDVVLGSYMREHWLHARASRDAATMGDLDAMRGSAKELSELEPVDELPMEWLAFEVEVRKRAQTLAASPDQDEAGRDLATLAVTCSSCHQVQGKGPTAGMTGIPADARDPANPVTDHEWASEWMWLGLVGGSAEVFTEGAVLLSTADMATKVQGLPPDAKALETRVQTHADKASKASNPGERATLYGGVVAGCAACHGTMKE